MQMARWAQESWTDFRDAFRSLRRNPVLTITALLTLTLAVGANAAIFNLANALLFASLPVPHPEQLVAISSVNANGTNTGMPIPTFLAIGKRIDAFASVFGWDGGGLENLTMNRTAFTGGVDDIAGDYYQTLGIRPALGRFITAKDIGLDPFAPANVAVIGYRAWQEHYRGDPGTIGKTISVSGKPFTIIGVHPPSFRGLIREIEVDVTIPITASQPDAQRVLDKTKRFYVVTGRLRDGVDLDMARARAEAVWPSIRSATAPQSSPDRQLFLGSRIQVAPANIGISYLRERFTRPLYVLLGAAGLLLALACVNLANVTLARAIRRDAEFRIRAALGANRWRLVRASLVESLVLGLCGAVPGLAFGYMASSYLARFMWQGFTPLTLRVTPDVRVFAFTFLAAIAASLSIGLAPAWRAGRQDPGPVVQHASFRVVSGLGRSGQALVVLQLALSFAILAGALLLGRSVGNVLHQDPGFQADHLLVAQLFPRTSYAGVNLRAYIPQLVAALRTIPGVSAASFAHDRPLGMRWKTTVQLAGVVADYRLVTPGFFDTLGIPVVRGRDFTARDDDRAPAVAVVSAKLARLIAPNGNAIGRRIRLKDEKGEFEIAGIVGDATLDDPRAPNAPAVYAAALQHPDLLGWGVAIVRSRRDPRTLTTALRHRIESLGREYPLRIDTVAQERDVAMVPERILSLIVGFFGAAALSLAGIGLYGLLSYTVTQRTRELGVRMALGATRSAVGLLVMRNVGLMLLAGLAAGLGLAVLGGRAVSAFLYGLTSSDPSSLALAAGVLLTAAGVASVVPAIRAVNVDPAASLREE